MHGSIGTSCAVADVQGDRATVWSATQSAYPMQQHLGDDARPAARQRPRHLHARRRLLRHQRRRHGHVRRGAAVAGGRQAGARAALAQGRNGVGELRQPVRDRSARRPRRDGTIVAWDHEAWSAGGAAAPATTRPATSSPACWSASSPAPFTPRTARAAADRLRSTTAEHRAVVCRRPRARHASAARASSRSERVLSHRVRSPFFTGPLRSPERLQNTFAHECFMDEIAAHVKADPVAYRLRHLRTRGSAKRSRGGEERRTGSRGPRRGRASARTRRRQRPRHRVRLLRRRQRIRRDGGRGRRRSGTGRLTSSGWSSRRTAGRSRIPTACATRSKAARCRA